MNYSTPFLKAKEVKHNYVHIENCTKEKIWTLQTTLKCPHSYKTATVKIKI